MSNEHSKEIIAQLEQGPQQSRCHEKALEDLLEIKLNEICTHYHVSRTTGSLLVMQNMLRWVTGT